MKSFVLRALETKAAKGIVTTIDAALTGKSDAARD
jgi:hypothetical protein